MHTGLFERSRATESANKFHGNGNILRQFSKRSSEMVFPYEEAKVLWAGMVAVSGNR